MAPTTLKSTRKTARGVAEMPQNLPLMLDPATCGQIAGVTAKCIRDQLAAGKIKGCKVGNAWRVHRDAFIHDYMGM